jgi:hypothetical protein
MPWKCSSAGGLHAALHRGGCRYCRSRRPVGEAGEAWVRSKAGQLAKFGSPRPSPISGRASSSGLRPRLPMSAELRFGVNAGAASSADGAARRRLPIASLVAHRLTCTGEQAPGAVALVTERAPAAPPCSLLRWTSSTSDRCLSADFSVIGRMQKSCPESWMGTPRCRAGTQPSPHSTMDLHRTRKGVMWRALSSRRRVGESRARPDWSRSRPPLRATCPSEELQPSPGGGPTSIRCRGPEVSRPTRCARIAAITERRAVSEESMHELVEVTKSTRRVRVERGIHRQGERQVRRALHARRQAAFSHRGP